MKLLRVILCLLLSSFSFASLQAQSFEEYRKKKQQQFANYKQQKEKQFEDYRRQRNVEYAKYMEQTWKTFTSKEPLPLPKDEEKTPVIYDKKEERKEDQKIETVVLPYERHATPQPQPLEPIQENEFQAKTGSFMFYGTKLCARWGDVASLKLKNVNEKEVSRAFLKLTDKEYTNLLSDCLSLRDKYHLCDWAYYMMLKMLSETACGKETNEATMLRGVLMCQSGYKVRFSLDKPSNKLYLLVCLTSNAYRCTTFIIDNEIFSNLDGYKFSSLNIMTQRYKGEKPMSLHINELPLLDKRLSDKRTITSPNSNISVTSVVNRNLVDFFNDYPVSNVNENSMVRWAYYADTPVSDEVREYLYPALQEKISGYDQRTAINILLRWCQFSLPYESDNVNWGYDRAFFAEETLFYPSSDCEDHAILFSHIVRDLLGLDVALIYLPNHLLTAVCFTENVKGDSTTIDGRRFVLCDPTYEGYPAGRIGSEYAGINPEAILLKR